MKLADVTRASRPSITTHFACIELAVLPGGFQGTGVVVDVRQTITGPLVMHESVCKTLDDLPVQRGIAALAANIDAEGCLERVIVVETVGQRLEYGLSLVDREPHGNHMLARLCEQLPHDDAGIACIARRIGPADNDLDRRRNVTSGLSACGEGAKQERDMGGWHIPPGEFPEALRHRRGVHVGDVIAQRQRTQWRRQEAGFEQIRKPEEIVPIKLGQWAELHQDPSSARSKNAASCTATVGTTSARSRKSLRCSQLVSAIRRQP